MKPGDKVWVWNYDAHEIQEVTISILGFEKSSDIINTRTGRTYTALVRHDKNGTMDYSILVPCKYCFPTREALCEHYRKIFE